MDVGAGVRHRRLITDDATRGVERTRNLHASRRHVDSVAHCGELAPLKGAYRSTEDPTRADANACNRATPNVIRLQRTPKSEPVEPKERRGVAHHLYRGSARHVVREGHLAKDRRQDLV